MFSFDYVPSTSPAGCAGLRFFYSNEALACGFHPLLSGFQATVLPLGIFTMRHLKPSAVARM
ncbi:hypothetical protein EMIT0P253_400044 [Pseudomonas sp. IT-P253]